MPKEFTHVLLGGAVYIHVSQSANTHIRTTGHGN